MTVAWYQTINHNKRKICNKMNRPQYAHNCILSWNPHRHSLSNQCSRKNILHNLMSVAWKHLICCFANMHVATCCMDNIRGKQNSMYSAILTPGKNGCRGCFKVCLAFANAFQGSFLLFGRWSMGQREKQHDAQFTLETVQKWLVTLNVFHSL